MADEGAGGRANQRWRTRKELLETAARLAREGARPSLEEVAEAARISRATAYRYFANIEALLLEAAIHVASPDLALLDGAPDDVLLRLRLVDNAFQDMMLANEAPLRLMLGQAISRAGLAEAQAAPRRQNRRSPLIAAALDPVRPRMATADFERLVQALSLLIGPEAFIVTRDVLQLGDEGARAVKRWAIEALLDAALSR